MAISALRISDFRNLAAVEIAPCQQGLNFIYGNNGSGKTSLLEAIHYLGLGRSFRSSWTNGLIRHQSSKFSLYAQLVTDSLPSPGAQRGERGGSEGAQIPHAPITAATQTIGAERAQNGHTRLRLSGKETTITDIALFLPIRVINSHSHQLFEAGPVFRRKYLDWGLFYQMPAFLPCWRQFLRVLKHRNAVLRAKLPKKELDVWTNELLKYGQELDSLRREYIQMLSPLISEMAQVLLGISNLETRYQPGWEESMDFASALSACFPQELRSGHTLAGPHRADLDVSVNGVQAKHILSRGQQKLLVCAMILAQGMLLSQQANKGLVYLIDDLPSELDGAARKKLMTLLAKQRAQVFITAIESEIVDDFHIDGNSAPVKVFHVEHGEVTECIRISA